MKKIDISTPKHPNAFALVSDDLFDELNQWKWWPLVCGRTQYAIRETVIDGVRSFVLMHRQIMKTEDGLEVDHIDGNGLNNQRENLRNCTPSENKKNCKLRMDSTSGYKGVDWCACRSRWRARITIDGKIKYLGRYTCLVKAAKAYDAAARKYHGEFASLNFKEQHGTV